MMIGERNILRVVERTSFTTCVIISVETVNSTSINIVRIFIAYRGREGRGGTEIKYNDKRRGDFYTFLKKRTVLHHSKIKGIKFGVFNFYLFI